MEADLFQSLNHIVLKKIVFPLIVSNNHAVIKLFKDATRYPVPLQWCPLQQNPALAPLKVFHGQGQVCICRGARVN